MAEFSILVSGYIRTTHTMIDAYIAAEKEYFSKIEHTVLSIEELKVQFPGIETLKELKTHIDFLDRLLKTTKSRSRKRKERSFETVTTHILSEEFIFDLRRKMGYFTSSAFTFGLMGIQEEHHYKSVVEDGLELLYKEHHLKEEIKEEPRYLVVSSGCAVCILDLNQSKDEQLADDQVLALPKRALLKLIDNQLPVSVGLFRLGSYAYITGGHESSSLQSEADCKLYKHLWVEGFFKGASCDTYRLVVDKEEDGEMTISPVKCDDMGLLSPKSWPVVEEIGKELHVFDSNPSRIFSHEAMGSALVSTTGLPGFIDSHVVLGHRIYAVTNDKNLSYENMKWRVHDRLCLGNPGLAKTVWDILVSGNATCVGQPQGSELYVIVAVVRNDLAGYDFFDSTTASYAYLVTLEGEVVCIQALHHLFLKTEFEPYAMVQGSVIKAGNDGWAAIVIGKALANESRVDDRDYLFVYRFTVKDCIRAVVSDAIGKGADKYLQYPSDVLYADFVRVDVKARYIYRTNGDFDDDAESANFVGLRACFLDSL